MAAPDSAPAIVSQETIASWFAEAAAITAAAAGTGSSSSSSSSNAPWHNMPLPGPPAAPVSKLQAFMQLVLAGQAEAGV
jgi:hypothetical protein